MLDGVCYQLRSDGSATVADLDELTPFAAVTWFHPDHTIAVSEPCDRAGLKTLIDESLDSTNLMVAVRVAGDFSMVRTRTVTKQQPALSSVHRGHPRAAGGDLRGCDRDTWWFPHARV